MCRPERVSHPQRLRAPARYGSAPTATQRLAYFHGRARAAQGSKACPPRLPRLNIPQLRKEPGMQMQLLAALIGLSLLPAGAQNKLEFKRTEDVLYGRKFGTALTLDVFQPPKPNGFGIIFMVSGGFFSS